MSLTSTEIQARTDILEAYFQQLAKKYADKIKFGASTKYDTKKLAFIQAYIEDNMNQATITTSADEYCLTEDELNAIYEQLPTLIGLSCVNIYDIDLETLDTIIGAILAEDDSFMLGEDGSVILGE